MRRLLLVLAVLLGLVAAPAWAQTPSRSPAERAAALAQLDSLRSRHGSDSAAAARVFTHVWEFLAARLLAASLDTATVPWTIELAEPRLPQARLLAHLRTALRARPPVPGDTLVWWLYVGPVEVRGDTARAHVRDGATRRCGPGSASSRGGWGNDRDVIVPRAEPGGPWGTARTRQVRHGDFARCQPAGP